jgi:hypothetical protein
MITNKHAFGDRAVSQKVIGVFYEVYNELGHGFLESVYQKSLCLALVSAGLEVCSPVVIPVWFRGHQVGHFEGDILVEKCLLLELKAVRGAGFGTPGTAAELSTSNGYRSGIAAELRRET